MSIMSSPARVVHSESADEYRPTFYSTFTPSPWAAAYWEGLQLGLAGECAASLHGTPSEQRGFLAGLISGQRQFEAETAAWVAQMEAEAEAAADPFGGMHPIELVEAFGSVALRTGRYDQ